MPTKVQSQPYALRWWKKNHRKHSFSRSGWYSCCVQGTAHMPAWLLYLNTSCLTCWSYTLHNVFFFCNTNLLWRGRLTKFAASANSELFFFLLENQCSRKFLNFSIDNRWALRLAQGSADFFFHNTVSCAMSKIVSFSRFEFKRVATRLKSHVSSVNSCQNLYLMAQRNHPLCRTKHSFMTLLGGTD